MTIYCPLIDLDMIDIFPPLSQTGQNFTESNARRPLQSMFFWSIWQEIKDGRPSLRLDLSATARSNLMKFDRKQVVGILDQSICYEKAWDWPNKNRNFTVQN